MGKGASVAATAMPARTERRQAPVGGAFAVLRAREDGDAH